VYPRRKRDYTFLGKGSVVTLLRRTALAVISTAALVIALLPFTSVDARAAVGTVRDCGVYFIGVHGMNQGPDENGVTAPGAYPSELSETLKAFSVEMHRGGGNFQGWEFLPYPVAHNDNWFKVDLLFSYSVRAASS
jgi:hypothetical protein